MRAAFWNIASCICLLYVAFLHPCVARPVSKKEIKEDDYQISSVEIESDPNDKNEQIIKVSKSITLGQGYARTLKTLPANVCTTKYMVEEAQKLNNANAQLLEQFKVANARYAELMELVKEEDTSST